MAELSERHALYVGWALGVALRQGVPIEPVRDEAGNYTDRLVLHVSDQADLTVVVPPPPEDWQLTEV